MLGLTYIYFDIICFCIFTDDHTRINFFTGTDEECSTLLSTVQTISYRLTGLVCNQRSLFTILDISLIWSVSVECSVHDTISLCVCQEITTVTDQTTGWDTELKTCISTIGSTHCL